MLLWLVGIIHDVLNCRSFGAARFKATIKRKRFSKQNAELTLCFWHRRRGVQIPCGRTKKSMRGHGSLKSVFGTKRTNRNAAAMSANDPKQTLEIAYLAKYRR